MLHFSSDQSHLFGDPIILSNCSMPDSKEGMLNIPPAKLNKCKLKSEESRITFHQIICCNACLVWVDSSMIKYNIVLVLSDIMGFGGILFFITLSYARTIFFLYS